MPGGHERVSARHVPVSCQLRDHPKGVTHGRGVPEHSGHIGLQQDDVRAFLLALAVLAPDSFGEVVLVA